VQVSKQGCMSITSWQHLTWHFMTPARHTKLFCYYYFNYFRHVAMLQKFAGPLVGAPFLWGPLFSRTCWTCLNPPLPLWRHWWRHNSETITEREKRRPPRPMKSSELSNGENCIALRQFCKTGNDVIDDVIIWVQDGNCKKIARENFSIGAFYNITKNQDNPIKTVGRDSFWAQNP